MVLVRRITFQISGVKGLIKLSLQIIVLVTWRKIVNNIKVIS